MNRLLQGSLIGLFLLGSAAIQTKMHFFGEAIDRGGLAEHYASPDFSLKTSEGKTVSLSDFRGKPVVIDFFATYCGPCRQEMISLKNWRKRRLKKSLPEIPIVVVSVDKDVYDLEHYIKTHDYPFIFLHDLGGKVSKLYNVQGVPTVYLIGADGTILDTTVGVRAGMNESFDRLAANAVFIESQKQ